jgi:predicted TIM-barrel fold metal-dependent hydrolase
MIDAHTHVFLQDMPRIPNPRHAPDYSFTVEQLIATLDANGVAKSVIAAASPWGDYNDYVIASVRKFPQRLRGTIIANPATLGAYEMAQMQRDGIVGVRLPFINQASLPDLTSWDWRKFLRRVADLNWHVHLHIEGAKLPAVLPLLAQSGVNIVIDHIGRLGPQDDERSAGFLAMLHSVEAGRTWVKLSGAYRLHAQARVQAQALCKRVGYSKMFWASDCPFVGCESQITYQQTVDWLNDTIADPVDRQQVFADNAQAFYFST